MEYRVASGVSERSAALDRLQCLGGCQAGGADGRVEPGGGADEEGGAEAGGDGAGGDDDLPVPAGGVPGGHRRADGDPTDPTEYSQQQRFGEELDADVAFGGAKGAA